MKDEQIFENEIKCIIRRNEGVCNGGSDCIKCDLLMDSEEIVKCYNRAIKNIELINRQKAEIKRLGTELDLSKSFHKEAVAERNFYYHQMIRFENMFKTAKSEAIKEFAERLKRTSVGLEIGDDKKFKMTVVSTAAIDNLVKEMTEEKSDV